MKVVRYSILFLLAASVISLQAQTPCSWDQTAAGKITETCGSVGAGTLAPWGTLHVKGTGQSAPNPELTATSQNGATLFVQDSNGNAGNGGMVVFGAAGGFFAGIKGFLGDGTGNSTGHLLFLTRSLPSDTALTERMRLFGGTGHLGIGTASDSAGLHVLETSPTGWALNSDLLATINANGSNTAYAQVVRANYNVAAGITNNGSVIGQHLEAVNTGGGNTLQAVGQVIYAGQNGTGGTVTAAYGSLISLLGSGITYGYGVYVGDIPAPTAYAFYQAGSNDTNYFAGKVGIGTATPGNYQLRVNGNVQVDGTLTGTNVQAQYQDVAEWVPAREDLSAGTVVVLDPTVGNMVMQSTRPYDTSVAGVVSERPGIVLGVGDASKEQIATTGRVRVRVDATTAPIHIGDLLVSSSKPGTAMKSQPIDVGGVAMHRPGTIIGKALEELPGGEGEILVLLSLQ